MTYTSVSRVRGLFGFSDKDIQDTPLNELIAYVDQEIDVVTGTTWTGSEPHFPLVQEAATILAGSLVYKRFRDQQELSKQLWDEGEKTLRDLGRAPYSKATSYEVIDR
jgi:organic radical activating enzyme